MWHLVPNNNQPPIYRLHLTHERPLPLPAWNTLHTDTGMYHATYAGHGQTKVVYRLCGLGNKFDECILKIICPPKDDPEIEGMQRLEAVRSTAAMEILSEGNICTPQYPSLTAWVTRYAQPLDQFLNSDNAHPPRCILSALLALLRATECNCLVTDCGFYNFGVFENEVRIIDLGSRGIADERPLKSTITKNFFRKFSERALKACYTDNHTAEVNRYLSAYRQVPTVREAILLLENEWVQCPTVRKTGESSSESEGEKADWEQKSASTESESDNAAPQQRGSSSNAPVPPRQSNTAVPASKRYENAALAGDNKWYTRKELQDYYKDESIVEERIKFTQYVMNETLILLRNNDKYTEHEIILIESLKKVCPVTYELLSSSVDYDACDKELLCLSTAFHLPLYYRHTYLKSNSLSSDTHLSRKQGEEAMGLWRNHFKKYCSSVRSNFWANVNNTTGCTQLAKLLINHGLSDIDRVVWLLYDLAMNKSSPIHQQLKRQNFHPLNDEQRSLRTKAKAVKYALKRAKRRCLTSTAIEELERKCETHLKAYNDSKRIFVDIVQAVEESYYYL